MLRSIPGLARLRDRDLAWLSARFDHVCVEAGTVLAREGRHDRQLLLIVEGQAVLSVAGEPRALIGAGQFVGELGALENAPHSATVTTQTPTRLLAAGPASVGTLLGHPQVLRQMATSLAGRLQRAEGERPTGPTDNVVALRRTGRARHQ